MVPIFYLGKIEGGREGDRPETAGDRGKTKRKRKKERDIMIMDLADIPIITDVLFTNAAKSAVGDLFL
jgi:hypothetical protein